MNIPRFELERWMHHYEADPPRHDLSGSTGPYWTVAEILDLDPGARETALAAPVIYAPTNGSEALRQEVAAHIGAAADDVLITTGASEALSILVAAHARPGANVVLPDPGYPPFAHLADVFRIEPRPYRLSRETQFRLDPERIADLMDHDTVLVIVNSPHNPSGDCASRDEILALQAAAASHGATLVVDQVFHPIYHRAEPLRADDLEGAVVIGDMSKALSLAGLRIGWITDRDAKRRQAYFDLRGFFTLSGLPLAEHLATVALRHSDRIVERAQGVASENLRALEGVLEGHADKIDFVPIRGGLTVFPWFRQAIDTRPFCRNLAEAGVLAAPGDCFGRPDHFRLGVGAPSAADYQEAMQVLDGALEQWHPA
ncbi:MAG: pyridoxal phosphate-dependent aminotransferase [Acidobacteriota bacterium]